MARIRFPLPLPAAHWLLDSLADPPGFGFDVQRGGCTETNMIPEIYYSHIWWNYAAERENTAILSPLLCAPRAHSPLVYEWEGCSLRRLSPCGLQPKTRKPKRLFTTVPINTRTINCTSSSIRQGLIQTSSPPIPLPQCLEGLARSHQITLAMIDKHPFHLTVQQ